MTDVPLHRDLPVPEAGAGMRLDRFLAARFPDRSRSWLAAGIREGQVCDADDRPLRPAFILKGGETLRVYLPGIAPSEPPPPFPTVLYEDDRVAVVDKPAGLLAHPSGTRFVWALIGLARTHWPDRQVDLVHRLDRDTSGVLALGLDPDSSRHMKESLFKGRIVKEYEALCHGVVGWDEQKLTGPIGSADGPVRIQMAVRPDGLHARTDVTVLDRRPHPRWPMSRVRCRLHTGRTHQIRVHMQSAGHPLLGDRLYATPPGVFLEALETGVMDEAIAQAGAPRQALHARRIVLPHPDGGDLEVVAPFPADMQRWWDDPDRLPNDEDPG